MKKFLGRYLHGFREGFLQMLRLHPVEAALIACGFVGCIHAYEWDTDEWMPQVALAALFFFVALVVNRLAGRGPWRKVYWVCWTPIVPLAWWSGLEEWIVGESALITYAVLVPLALLLCSRALRNKRFVDDAFVWLRAGILSLFYANVALGLFVAILYSTTYIFGLEGKWIDDVWMYALIFCEICAVPFLFLMMSDRWRGAEITGNRILEVLLNYVVTPALLIYTAILYLYMAKILVTWTLPEGGVAYLVFGFTLFALFVKGMQCMLVRRIYDRFFDRFSLISLPTQVLFWIGVLRRTGEYGLTEPRVYLIVCGGLMTLCVLLFLSRRTGRYLYLASAAFLCFGVMAYVPALQPARVAVRSQVKRAVTTAERLGMLDAQGRLVLQITPDSTQRKDYRTLYEALQFLSWKDSKALERFGLEDMETFREAVPETAYTYIVYGYDIVSPVSDRYYSIDASSGRRTDIGGYKTLYTNIQPAWNEQVGYRFVNDTLRVDFVGGEPSLRIAGSELLRQSLRRAGLERMPEKDLEGEQADRALYYEADGMTIVFSGMVVERQDSTDRLSDISIDAILIK